LEIYLVLPVDRVKDGAIWFGIISIHALNTINRQKEIIIFSPTISDLVGA